MTALSKIHMSLNDKKFPRGRSAAWKIATAVMLGWVMGARCIAAVFPAMAVIENGQCHAAIVIGGNATVVERFAAEELQSYVSQLTASPAGAGPKLPIVIAGSALPSGVTNEIVIGRRETNPRMAAVCSANGLALGQDVLGEDGYVVRTVPEGAHGVLVLGGSQDRSALYAVYHFLETQGVRFFGYRSRNGEVVPHLSSLRIGELGILEKPQMKYRFVSNNSFSASDKTKLTDVADWGAKNRCNTFMLSRARVNDTSWSMVALDEVHKRGFLIVGPGHCLAQFTPGADLFKTHPEYFPMIKGRRNAMISKEWGGATAFCYSNPEAMRLVAEHAARYFDQNPFIDLFAIYPPDGSQHGSQCQCEECSKHTMSEWYLAMLNHIDEALKSRPVRPKLMWISYNECSVPPQSIRPVDDGKDFVLFWCNELRDHARPMDSEANHHASRVLEWKPRLRQIKTDWKSNPSDEDLAAFYRWKRWSQLLKADNFAGSVVLLDYYNEHVSKSLYVPMLGYCQSGPWPGDLMQQDFKFYAREGINGWQNCTDYYNDKPNPYWNYLNARMMWNPEENLSSISRDFYQKFYGAAGDALEKYYTALWLELASPDLTLASQKRVEALGLKLEQALAQTAPEPDPSFSARLKEVRSFQQHCVEVKAEVARTYQPDGTPKELPKS
jgi:hypothetical protein